MKNNFPSLFIGHGSPMTIIEDNPFTVSWHHFANKIKRPQGIIIISAHWVTKGNFILMNRHPEQINDFYGFPQKLYDIQYSVEGHVELAQKIIEQSLTAPILPDTSWGIDHGMWTVLYKMYPKADIPIIPISINVHFSLKEHYEFAKQFKKWRNEDILILGSGNIVHNLRLFSMRSQLLPYDRRGDDWAKLFLNQVIKYIEENDMNGLIDYANSYEEEVRKSIPTPEHFIPLLYVLAQRDNEDIVFKFNQCFEANALDMTCIALMSQN